MELKLYEKNLESFKGVMNLVKTVLVEYCKMQFSEDGIQILGMDPAHIAMIDAKIKPGLFETFTPGEAISINVSEFTRFLDRSEKKERVTISVDSKAGKLIIAGEKSGWKRKFGVPILEDYESEIPEPKIIFKASVKMLTSAFDKALKDADLVSEHVSLEINDGLASLKATGDMGEASNLWEKDSEDILEIKAEEKASAMYTLSYLRDMTSALKAFSEMIRLEMSTDMPIKIEGYADAIEVILFLAPMIGA
uniref:PCNA n=1 Tax=viral metagenome TaxID=1070528 RepID=A0A6M3LZB9_9ZZZZ